MNYFWILPLISFTLRFQTLSSASIQHDPINIALMQLFSSGNDLQYRRSLYNPKLQRRCYKYLACEFTPHVDMDKVAFMNGVVSFPTAPRNQTIQFIKELRQFHAAKPGHLPSCQAQVGFNLYDFVAGPQINLKNIPATTICEGKWKNESSLFLFPMEIFNAFHAMNDNLFVALSSVYLQAALYPESRSTPKALYVFRALNNRENKTPTNMFQLLNTIFHKQTYAAGQLLQGGPHCIDHVSWGTALKPFYRDSLFYLRMKLHDFFKTILHFRYQLPLHANDKAMMIKMKTGLKDKVSVGDEKNENRRRLTANRSSKVLIMTRRSHDRSNTSPDRKIAYQSEINLLTAYKELGARVEMCCDFALPNKKLTQKLWNVDICIGIHGAGLSNCLFGQEGMIIVELHAHYNFALDSFIKLAHMTKGHYLFYDIRHAPLHTGSGPGSILSAEIIADLVSLSFGMWKYSMHYGIVQIKEQMSRIDRQGIPSDTFDSTFDSNNDIPSTTTSIQRYYQNPALIHSVLSRQEIVVNMEEKKVYFDSEQRKDAIEIKNIMSIVRKPISEVNNKSMQSGERPFTMHNLTEHAAYIRLDNLGKVMNKAGNTVMSKKNPTRYNHTHIQQLLQHHHILQYEPIHTKTKTSPREYFLFFHPYATSTFKYDKESILGPILLENYLHCVQLPVFKLRMLFQSFAEHMGECDLATHFMFRSGKNDQKLLSAFL